MWSQRSQSVACALVLIVINIPKSWTQNNGVPRSPCPDVFNYETDDGYEYYGWGKLIDIPIGDEINLRANIFVEPTAPRTNNGKIQIVGEAEEVFRRIKANRPIYFQIIFPVQNPLPTILTITVNSNLICQSTYHPSFRFETMMTLHDRITRTLTNYGNDFPPIPSPRNQNNNRPISRIPFNGNSNQNGYPDEFDLNQITNPDFEINSTDNPTTDAMTTTSEPTTMKPTTTKRTKTTKGTTTTKRTSTTKPPTTASIENFNTGCGKIPKLFSGLAFGGTTIDKGDWPWLVAIHTYQRSSLSFRCGGTIISNTAVLSAAHCFYIRQHRINAEAITMFLGHHNIEDFQEEGSKIVKGSSLVVHPDFKPDIKLYSDIAIVKFVKVVYFSEFIQPACLWSGDKDITTMVGRVGSLVGWGRDENGNLFTPEPKKVQVPIVSDEVCLRSHEVFSKTTNERTFCGGWRNGTDGPCTGDSGTGMMLNLEGIWYIRGVVSSSVRDPSTATCNLNEYVVFTDVAKFSDWIQTNMS